MLPQFGLSEFLLLAVAALIVVGPKDLPMMMRRLGQFVAKGKALAAEFRSAFDDMARQAELDELREEIEDLKKENAVKQAADDLRAVEQDINASVMSKSDKA
ncbi:MAG: Sec-independent protein translocase protein TatB [Pseudomonadota bacterium]